MFVLHKFLKFYFLFLSLNELLALSVLKPSEDYGFSLNVDEDDTSLYKLYWKRLENDEIQFEIHCRATGWVGFGISPNGGMAGSDIAIGWVDSQSKAHLKDTYATSMSTPLTDPVQNWELLDALEKDGYTILKIKRKLITCDKDHDFDIKFETQRLIFAWSNRDPISGINDWSYHGSNRRIVSVVLLNFQDEATLVSDSEITEHYNVSLNNYLLPDKQTFYMCKLFTLPPLKRDLHMLSYDILIDKISSEFVHHLVVYLCQPDDMNKVNKNLNNVSYECGPGLDEEIQEKALKDVCEMRTLIISWSVGGKKSVSFPENTGLRFSKSDKETLIFVDFHFENTRRVKDHYENSGFNFKFTRNLRKYDIGVLATSVRTNPLDITIPPNTDLIKISSICYPDCTEKYLPKEGITIFAGNFHTHLIGRALRTHLIRDGKVIKYLFDDQNYDFNYQSNMLIQPTKLLKGDGLILECFFSSENKNNFTFGGYSTSDEMCGVFMYYYPKIEFIACGSRQTDQQLAEFYNGLIKDSIIPQINVDSSTVRNKTKEIVNLLKAKSKSTKDLSTRFKNYFAKPVNQSAYCAIKDRNTGIFFEKQFYKPKETFVEKDTC